MGWLERTKTDRELYLFAKQNHFLFCLKLENGFSDLFKQSLSEVHSRWRTTCLRLLPRLRIALVKAAALSHDDHGSPASANIFLKAAFASANNTTAFKNDDVDTKAFSDLEMLFVSASKEEEEEDTIEVPVPEQHKSRFCWRGLARRSFGERKILFEKLRIFFEKNLPNDENQRQMLEKLFFSNISDVVDKAYETLPQSVVLKIVINLQDMIVNPEFEFLKSIGYRKTKNEFKKFILKIKKEEEDEEEEEEEDEEEEEEDVGLIALAPRVRRAKHDFMITLSNTTLKKLFHHSKS